MTIFIREYVVNSDIFIVFLSVILRQRYQIPFKLYWLLYIIKSKIYQIRRVFFMNFKRYFHFSVETNNNSIKVFNFQSEYGQKWVIFI